MSFGVLHSIWTVVLLVSFLGIVLWAYSTKRKSAFDAAARSVLKDNDAAQTGEKRGD